MWTSLNTAQVVVKVLHKRVNLLSLLHLVLYKNYLIIAVEVLNEFLGHVYLEVPEFNAIFRVCP